MGKPGKLALPSHESTIGKFLTQSGTFKDGDLLVNKDGLRIVPQSEEGEAPPIEPLDNHQLSIDDLDAIKVIGKGSSGIVQLVRHKWTGQFFALKVIQLNIQESIRKQIVQELKISLSTQCQYVVVCYQCFYVNGVISIALEYMDGGSLADFLKTVRTVPEAYLAAICKQVLKGLMYLHHEKHIIHRDLKPSNILINHRGEVKISDFGVSAIIASSSAQRDTFTGTFNYMAPERISGQKHGHISDIWSLGLVMLECATGDFPYPPHDSFYELLEAVVDKPPPSAPSDQFSAEFCSFISACIQKEAMDRSSAQVLLTHPFLSLYDDLNIDLADYFTTAGSPLATFKQIDPTDVLKRLCNSFPVTDIISVEPAKVENTKEIQTLHGSPHHPPLPGGSGDHPHLVNAELPSPRKTVELPERSMEAPVCALVDAMYRLPAKLDGLLRHGRMLPKGAEHEIPLIKQDLRMMIAVLHDYNNSGAEKCTVLIECLMKEVRELSYDIEDCIDQYEHAVDSRSRSVFRIPRRQITHRKSKANRLPKKLKQRLWMANKIREFSVRSQEALQRYSLFNPDGISTSSTRCDASFSSWHPTPYGECADHLAGIDAPMNKLEGWLTRDGEQKLKFVSILGSGGVGKTTLANELYRRIGWQFECRAFVRTSQKPDIRRLLISMLSQVRPNQRPGDWKVHSLIADIRTHLQHKRYLIVVDDVWATSTWDIVNCALPDGNDCSRILITTEIEDVALKCCGCDLKYVFKMKPLGEDDSRKLFFSTVVGPPESCEVSNSIIRKCGGLPLATVTIASLLASRMGQPEQWDYINKSLGYGLRTNPDFEGMKQVLNLSYNNLPQHLKPCLLYLSIYQEDHIIWKDDLVKQWIAEGFICATEGKDEEEISRSYFDELMSSRMIQPVYKNDTNEILSCTVHYMVLNFIKHKSIIENFVTAIDHSQTSTRLADKVRRLSLHFGNAEDATQPTNMRLSQIRTLAFFGVFNCVPSIMEFRLLQVLILQFWGDEESISLDLTGISELFRLRYLQVTSNVTLELRTQMQGLQCLETLKIDARVSAFPSDFVHLLGLLHLNLPVETNLPDGIGHMKSLRTVGNFDLSSNSKENVQCLGELTNLQDLQLTYSAVRSGYVVGNMECMGSILGKLNNLMSLTLVSAGSSDLSTTDTAYQPSSMILSGDGLSSMSSPPVLLHRLELPNTCIFSSLPKWIGELSKLCILKITVRELSRDDIDVLKELPALTVLSLFVRTVPSERIAFNKTGFLFLKYFKFKCTVPCLKFEANAMPNLWKLKLGFSAVCYGATPVGIEYLSGLKEVSAKIWCVRPEESNRMTAESVLRDTIRMHPGRPRVHIQHVDKMFDGQEDKSSVTEQEHGAFEQYDILQEDTNEQHEALQKNSGEDANKQANNWAISSPRKSTINFPGSWVKPQLVLPLSRDPFYSPGDLDKTISSWSMTDALAPQQFNQRPEASQSAVQGDQSEQRPHSEFSFPTAAANDEVPRSLIPLDPPHSHRQSTEDGYNWRKYGQKMVQGRENRISYYQEEGGEVARQPDHRDRLHRQPQPPQAPEKGQVL